MPAGVWQVAEVLRLQEENGKVNIVDIIYALPPKKNKKRKNTPAVGFKYRREVLGKHVTKKSATKATGVQS